MRRKPPKNYCQPFMTPISMASIILLLEAKKAHFYYFPWRQYFQSKLITFHTIYHAELFTENLLFTHSLGLLLGNSYTLYLIFK